MGAFENPDCAYEILINKFVLSNLRLRIIQNLSSNFGLSSRYGFSARSDHFALAVFAFVTIICFDGLANQGITAGI